MNVSSIPLRRLILSSVCSLFALAGVPSVDAQNTGTIEGRASSSYNGEGLGRVELTLEGTAFGSSTDDLGRFLLLNVPAGTYNLRASSLGYSEQEQSVTVQAGEASEVEFVLDPTGPGFQEAIDEETALGFLQGVFEDPDSLDALLPDDDWQDPIKIPLWFRAYHRHLVPGLPTTGPYQYPHAARELYDRMVRHPDSAVIPRETLTKWDPQIFESGKQWSMHFRIGRGLEVDGKNINLSNMDLENRETSISIDAGDPRYVIAAANNTSDNPGAVIVFRSSDYGVCWNSTLLPLPRGPKSQADPSVAWDSQGVGWMAALEIDLTEDPSYRIKVFRSDDRGTTWDSVAVISTDDGNDKPMLALGPVNDTGQPAIYVAWGTLVHDGIFFRRSRNGGEDWDPIVTVSPGLGFGAHLALGPNNEIYLAWRDSDSLNPKILLATSTNGGTSFTTETVETLNTPAMTVPIPAASRQEPMIYPVVAVDRTGDPTFHGRVYVTWMDLDKPGQTAPGNDKNADANTDIFLKHKGPGALGWGPTRKIPPTTARRDQFNPWIDVDQTDGRVHVSYYDTEGIPTRESARFRHIAFGPGGETTPSPPTGLDVATEVTEDLSAPVGFQFGDYAGLAVAGGRALPIWTDRRTSALGEPHQAFSAVVKDLDLEDVDCEPGTITFVPSTLGPLRKKKSVTVHVKLEKGGTAAPGEWVGVESKQEEILSFSGNSGLTDSAGETEFTIKGERKGTATVVAGSMGAVAEMEVKVINRFPWWIWVIFWVIVIILVIWLIKKFWPLPWWVWLILLLIAIALIVWLVWKYWA